MSRPHLMLGFNFFNNFYDVFLIEYDLILVGLRIRFHHLFLILEGIDSV